MVLPAFETAAKVGLEEGRVLAQGAIERGKTGLGSLLSSGQLQGFASVVYPKGHACTNFVKW